MGMSGLDLVVRTKEPSLSCMLPLLTLRVPKESPFQSLDTWLLLSLLPGAAISRDQGRFQTQNSQLVPDHRAGRGSALTGAHLSIGGAHRQEQ